MFDPHWAGQLILLKARFEHEEFGFDEGMEYDDLSDTDDSNGQDGDDDDDKECDDDVNDTTGVHQDLEPEEELG